MDAELDRTRTLIAQARAGERAAYEALFELHRAHLAQTLQRKFPAQLRNRVEVSDVVQESLLDAVRGFDSFEDRGAGSFRGWLARIAENRLRMTLKFHTERERRSVAREAPAALSGTHTHPGPIVVADATSPSSAAAGGEDNERLRRALTELSPDHAQVLQRVKLQGESISEVALAMRRSENAVKKLLARALLELSSKMGAQP
jgi:RNA polymerase sigma-70 factor (ECF subfamily)